MKYYIEEFIESESILNWIYIFILLILTSCYIKSNEYEYKKTIVSAKTIDLVNNSTRYNIAFTDGSSESFDFGLYNYYNIGDTICWEKDTNAWSWEIIKCENYGN